MRTMTPPRRMGGFTVVELMIALVLGLLVSSAVLSIFLTSRRSFDRDEMVQRMQDDARHAIRVLSADLSMAGYYADLMLPGAITLDGGLAVDVDCGPTGAANWIYQAVNPGTTDSLAVTFVDNATGAAANAAFACIDAAELEPGTDVIAIKRVVGAQTAVPDPDTVYLRTNGTLGLLYHEPAAAPAVTIPPPFTEWEYRPAIYYVRNYENLGGDGTPTLCRRVLVSGDPPKMDKGVANAEECLASGIENFQVEFGLDSDADGQPNFYLANPTLAQLQTAVSARISILARSVERDPLYTNDKTYSIANAPAYTPADNFYRRVFSITVGLHNLRNLRKLTR
jgi:type IV pilus assembly protein PilW